MKLLKMYYVKAYFSELYLKLDSKDGIRREQYLFADRKAAESLVDEFHKDYLGKRIKRGMFKSGIGKVINADINGALNILRKYLIKNVINEFSVIQKIIDRGLLYRPSRITIY